MYLRVVHGSVLWVASEEASHNDVPLMAIAVQAQKFARHAAYYRAASDACRGRMLQYSTSGGLMRTHHAAALVAWWRGHFCCCVEGVAF
jgi:hypothetical protein